MKWQSLKRLLPIATVAIGMAAGGSVWAANTTARPGTINYVEGQVLLDGQPLGARSIGSAELDSGQVLDTRQGKAEVLLTPGVFLRVGDNSEIRMQNPGLTQTSVAVTRGEALLEVSMLMKENDLQIADAGAVTTIQKNGLYRFTADANPTVSVIDGKADVREGDRTVKVKKDHQLLLTAANAKPQKFDKASEDDLYAWSKLRSEYVAKANAADVQMVVAGGLPWYGPGWYWSPWYGMYAFMPGDAAFISPFGYPFYSPFYNPWYYGGGVIVGRGYYGGGHGWWHHRTAPATGSRVAIGRRMAPRPAFRGGAPRMAITRGPSLGMNNGFGRGGFGGFHGGGGFHR
ncbi:MAG TPA: hypothetical protein VFA04_08120 [Bryobacteraceae bacterium]|nr:hypothetical protein [Bryobacteraceae bacterium]